MLEYTVVLPWTKKTVKETHTYIPFVEFLLNTPSLTLLFQSLAGMSLTKLINPGLGTRYSLTFFYSVPAVRVGGEVGTFRTTSKKCGPLPIFSLYELCPSNTTVHAKLT
jgi:hypothetical protein